MQYILVSSIVLSNTIWVKSSSISISQGKLIVIFSTMCCMLCIINFIYLNGAIIKKSLLTKIILVAVNSMVSAIVLKNDMVTYILYFVFPLLLCILYLGLEKNVVELWKKLSNVVVVLSIISLVFYLLGTILKALPPTSVTNYTWTWELQCKNWYNMYYEAYYGRTSMFSFLPRKNTGIYTEPPMFMIMVCLALAGEFAFVEKPRKFIISTLLITLITIMSTTGYIFVILCILLYILRLESGKRSIALRILIFPLLCLIGGVVVLEIMNTKIGTASGENSVFIRSDHLLTAYRLWIEKPILGIGYGQSELFLKSSVYHQGASVGLPLFLAYAGIWGMLLYLIPFIKSLYMSIRFNLKFIYFVLGTFTLLFLTSVNYLPIMIIVLGMLITYERTDEKIIEDEKICA